MPELTPVAGAPGATPSPIDLDDELLDRTRDADRSADAMDQHVAACHCLVKSTQDRQQANEDVYDAVHPADSPTEDDHDS